MNKLLLIIVLFSSCNFEKASQQYIKKQNIIAKKIPHINIYHNDTVIDNYHWMRLSDAQKESDNKDVQTDNVLNYLNSENDYLKNIMLDTESFQDSLFNEFVSRIEQDDESVPYSFNGYTYYTRYNEGDDYSMHYRKENIDNAKEELILNLPEMAKGTNYFSLGDKSISENNQLLAYSIDILSRRDYTIYFKDLSTGKMLNDKIENTNGRITWANDNKTIFYTKKDKTTLRSNQPLIYSLGIVNQSLSYFDSLESAYYSIDVIDQVT